jgi:hypothetical protein
MNAKLIVDLKYAFRDLCGVFSIEELVTNQDLIEAITQLEKAFSALSR